MRTRSLQLRHLSKLVDYLIAGARHIERQKAIIQELERDGHDAAQAQQTLQQMEELRVAEKKLDRRSWPVSVSYTLAASIAILPRRATGRRLPKIFGQGYSYYSSKHP
jgi:hypothetical protein